MNQQMFDQVKAGKGFIAALDQSGGSTPKALKLYGVEESEYSGDAAMFDLIHQMRSRLIKSKVFTGDRIVGAILFEMTMERQIDGIEFDMGDGVDQAGTAVWRSMSTGSVRRTSAPVSALIFSAKA